MSKREASPASPRPSSWPSHPGESLVIALGRDRRRRRSSDGRCARSRWSSSPCWWAASPQAGSTTSPTGERDAAAGRLDKPVAQGWIDGEHGHLHRRLRHLPARPAVDLQRHRRRHRAPALGARRLALLHPHQARRALSCLPWAVSFALLPAFLSYGGWGGGVHGGPPTILMTVLAGLLGIGVHVLAGAAGPRRRQPQRRAHLPAAASPSRSAPRKLLLVTGVYTVAVLAGIVVGRARAPA